MIYIEKIMKDDLSILWYIGFLLKKIFVGIFGKVFYNGIYIVIFDLMY